MESSLRGAQRRSNPENVRAPRSPGLLPRVPKPGGRNDDRGSTRMQLALRCGRHWRQTDPSSSSSGGVVGVERELDELFVPKGHISGSPLSETSTFLNTDLVSIGMFVAPYTGV